MTSTVIFLLVIAGFIAIVCLLHNRTHALRPFASYRVRKPNDITFLSSSGQIESSVYRSTIAATLTLDSFYLRESTFPLFKRYWKFPKSALRESKNRDWDYNLIVDGASVRMRLVVEKQSRRREQTPPFHLPLTHGCRSNRERRQS